MGVTGLLPLLKSIQKSTELKKFAGETLGVDAYGWLHRGAVACAMELAQGKPTRKYVDFAMHRVRMLRHFGVTPYVVFDGDFLPSKSMTEGSRAKRREESKKLGMELLKAGKPSQAYLEFQKAIDVTPEMARNLIDELKKLQIQYVVAPYEADAQLVYLERKGLVGGIISEDSDLLVFGCKRLLTKLDQYGNCVEINRRDFCACREISLTGWTDADFRRMAILSGCDYLAGINNMGLKTAHRMIRKYKTPERLVRMLQFEGKHRIPEDYLSQFFKAELTFLHQRVFCPIKQELVFLTEPQEGQGVEDMPFIGGYVEPTVARAVAEGDVNPMTKLRITPAPMPESKRRHSQSAARASAPTATFPSVISGLATARPGPGTLTKSIDSYFKGHRRIPMGEMDPNCFSVDPQRVAALTHNGLVPRVFPLPRPYVEEPRSATTAQQRPYVADASTAPQLRRRSEPIGNLLARATGATTSSSRRQTTGPQSNSAADIDALVMGAAQRPPKKIRLCADADANEQTEQRSKFFSTHKKRIADAEKKDELLFSDDSIEEALLSLPDVDRWHDVSSSRRSITVYEESPTQTTGKTHGTDSQSTSKDGEPASPSNVSPPELPETDGVTSEPPSATPLTSSLSRFAYSKGCSVSVQDTPSSAASSQSSIFTPSTSDPSTVASSFAYSTIRSSSATATKNQLLTPLQRIGFRALQRKPASHHKARSPKASPKRRGKRESLASLPVNPSFVPLPKVDLDEVEALNKPLGSEDHMVPDSDGENDMDEIKLSGLNGGCESPRTTALDLSRFTY
ncbi:exodeoxyribonuclease [Sodiomyces alkalinus F11]|uniref:Exodeoxyribonuclease n=1 Tax=Sodiomyces alkalinus (strain CBS 110278 / VKM F-3762 / F11) TaxID=1314773 RepID=A0A3N2PMK0_SODAK|nr:exodeoxyribonuclease [Sodiomyces alkalinus F11]ROT35761.1 exodeoxyribonuclease [Sodiomyces alkalinus F11]